MAGFNAEPSSVGVFAAARGASPLHDDFFGSDHDVVMTAGESLCRISFHLCERPVVLDHVVSVARPRVHDPRSATNPAPGRASHRSGRHVQGIYLAVLDLAEDDAGTGATHSTHYNAPQA